MTSALRPETIQTPAEKHFHLRSQRLNTPSDLVFRTRSLGHTCKRIGRSGAVGDIHRHHSCEVSFLVQGATLLRSRGRSASSRARRRLSRVSPWDNDELLRAELFSIERLEQHAGSLALAQPITPHPVRRPPLSARLSDNEAVLLSA